MHVSRITPGRPGGEFRSRWGEASFHARGLARAILQRRTHRWLFALRIRVLVRAFLPEPRSACRSHLAPSDLEASSPAGGKWRSLTPEVGRVRFPDRTHIWLFALASVYMCFIIA